MKQKAPKLEYNQNRTKQGGNKPKIHINSHQDRDKIKGIQKDGLLEEEKEKQTKALLQGADAEGRYHEASLN